MKLLVLLLTAAASLLAAQNVPIAVGAIEGTVINSITMSPLADAPITVSAGATQIGTISDSSGHFQIPSIGPGSYTVSATLEDYSGPETSGISASDVESNLYVISGQTSRITLALVPSASISGTVLDDAGAPTPGATVQLMRLIYVSGIPKLSDAGSQATDDQGNYRITRLRPGQYYAIAAPKSGKLTSTFYPSALDVTQAAAISLQPGDERTGTVITLQSGNLFRISGQVMSTIPDTDARTIPTATVTVLSHGPGLSAPGSAKSVSVSMGNPGGGRFEIRGIPAGVYDVYASLPDGRGGGLAYGRTTVSISGGDLDGVNIAVHRGVDVKGKVMVDGGTSPSFNNVRITLQPEDSAAALAGYQQISRFQPRIGSDGDFTIPAVPEGRYRVQVSFVSAPPTPPQPPRAPADPFAPNATPPPSLATVPLAGVPLGSNGYVFDMLQGGRTVYNTGIEVGTQAFEPLELHVRTDGGSVIGTVFDGTMRPVRGATVTLAPLVQYRQNPALFRTATSDENGRFFVTGIRPGEYKLLAWESIQPGANINPEILYDYRNKEYPITVPANIQVETKVTVIPR